MAGLPPELAPGLPETLNRQGLIRFLDLDSFLDEMHFLVDRDRAIPRVQGDPGTTSEFERYVSLLPENLQELLQGAINQDWPFLPPYVKPDWLTSVNQFMPDVTNSAILTKSLLIAFEEGRLVEASAVTFVLDRFMYFRGASMMVLQTTDLIRKHSRTTAISPQLEIRRARVLKDAGDLHGAFRVLDKVMATDWNATGPRCWSYKSEEQYNNVKAVCVQIKGQIWHNLGLWSEAIPLLVESIRGFESLSVKDEKGISSSQGLLAKCLRNLNTQEYLSLRSTVGYFTQPDPLYEAYLQSISGGELCPPQSLFKARYMMESAESLLRYANQGYILEGKRQELLREGLHQLKQSLSQHQSAVALQSREQSQVLLKSIYLCSLCLMFSTRIPDVQLAWAIEELTVSLFTIFSQSREGFGKDIKSIKIVNAALALLDVPQLNMDFFVRYYESLNNRLQSLAMNDSAKNNEQNNDVKVDPVKDDTNTRVSETDDPSINLENKDLVEVNVDNGQSQATQSSMQIEEENRLDYSQNPPQCGVVSNKTNGEQVTENRDGTQPIVSKDGLVTQDSKMQENDHRETSINNTEPVRLANQKGTHVDMTDAHSEGLKSSSLVSAHRFVGLPADPKDASLATIATEQWLSNYDSESKTPVYKVNPSATTICSTTDLIDGSNQESMPFKVDASATTVCSTFDPVESNSSVSSNTDTSTADSGYELLLDELDSKTRHPLVNLRPVPNPRDLSLLNVDEADRMSRQFMVVRNVAKDNIKNFEQKKGAARARQWMYDPLHGQWSAQSTMVYIGNKVCLKDGKEGATRDAIHVEFLHQDEPLGRYVGKRYRGNDPALGKYLQDVEAQMTARYYVTLFNQKMKALNCDDMYPFIQYLPASHLQVLSAEGEIVDMLNTEPYLEGDSEFFKLTSNFEFKEERLPERIMDLGLAFSHFSHTASQGQLMIVDLQGWIPRNRRGVLYLTDPQFHSVGDGKITPYDLRERGMEAFWKVVHPECNLLCKKLNLTRPTENQ